MVFLLAFGCRITEASSRYSLLEEETLTIKLCDAA
jgi:hypothetical protein